MTNIILVFVKPCLSPLPLLHEQQLLNLCFLGVIVVKHSLTDKPDYIGEKYYPRREQADRYLTNPYNRMVCPNRNPLMKQ